jgi:hypothetical protein
MGILVPELVTPEGETVSNAYVSYKNTVITTMPRAGKDFGMVGWASVYRDISESEFLFNFEIILRNADMTKGPFVNMYEALYAMFPTGIKCQEPEDDQSPS